MHTKIKASGMFGRVSSIAASLIAGSVLMFGCGPQQSDNTDSVERTVVRLNGDGQPVVTTSKITVAQQRAEIEARQRMIDHGDSGDKANSSLVDGLIADPGCGGSSLWLFDGAGLTGNEICFYGAGWTNLNEYLRFVFCEGRYCIQRFWDNAVASYWAGVSNGRFGSNTLSGFETFAPWQRVNYAGWVARSSDWVGLDH